MFKDITYETAFEFVRAAGINKQFGDFITLNEFLDGINRLTGCDIYPTNGKTADLFGFMEEKSNEMDKKN